MMNLNELRDRAYKNAVAHGWHEEDKSDQHWLCLVISEIMEAVEADRKGRHSDTEKFMHGIENYIHTIEVYKEAPYNPFEELFENHIKGTVEEELSDACIRLLDMAGLRDINLSSISFPISNSAEHINHRKVLTFTEWCYDVTRVIARYDKNNYPIGYLFIGILQEVCCIAEIIGFDLLWHIEQKMKYNELRPYKHDKQY